MPAKRSALLHEQTERITQLTTLAYAPQWLIDQCGAPNARRVDTTTPQIDLDTQVNVDRAIDWLVNRAPCAVLHAGSNQTTYAVAAKVKDFGISESMCTELMLDHWNENKSTPPWPPDKLADTVVAHAYRYGVQPIGADTPELAFQSVEVEAEVEPETETDNVVLHPIEALNREFAFVLTGGGHHILWETTDLHGRDKLEHLSEASFHKYHLSRTLRADGNRVRPLTELWMESRQRRTYRGLVFSPGGSTPDGYYNMWRGLAFAPLPADATTTDRAENAVKLFFDHLRENVCAGDPALSNWLIGWFAHCVQCPGVKPLTATVFRGLKGVGKNALLDRVGALIGGHYLVTSNRRYIVGNFNGHMENLLMFVLDEAYWSGDKAAEGQLKDLITGHTHLIEHKGKEQYPVANLTRIAIIGNEDWLVPATADERRYAVFNVGDARRGDRAYFREMREGMEADNGLGYRLLLTRLLSVDLSLVDVNEAPATQGLLDQKIESLDTFDKWWFGCLMDGLLLGVQYIDEWPKTIGCDELRKGYVQYARANQWHKWLRDERSIGRSLKQFGVARKRLSAGYVYTLPPLDVAQAAFAGYLGQTIDWSLG